MEDQIVENLEGQKISEDKTHGFSNRVAMMTGGGTGRILGYKAALILGYLHYQINHRANRRDDKYWYYASIEEIAAQYPYWSRSAVAGTLNHLIAEKVVEVGNYNRRSGDKTRWYTIIDPLVLKGIKKDQIRFSLNDAMLVGVPAAVLVANIVYWVRENRLTDPTYEWHRISAARMSDHLPFSKGTILRGLKSLEDAKLVARKPGKGRDAASFYRLTDETRLEQKQKEADPNLGMGGPNLEMDVPNPHMGGPNPHDVTCCKDSIEKISCFKENSYKESTTSSRSDCVSLIEETRRQLSEPPLAIGRETTDRAVVMRSRGSIDLRQSVPENPLKKDETMLWVPPGCEWTSKAAPRVRDAQSVKDTAEMVAHLKVLDKARFDAERANPAAYTYKPPVYPSESKRPKTQAQVFEKLQEKSIPVLQEAIEELEMRLEKYRSPDEAREELVDLSAKDKAKIFKNRILAYNRIGLVGENEICRHDLIQYHDRDFKAVERLFKANPRLTAGQLGEVIGNCAETNFYQPVDGFDTLFAIKRGATLSYFLCHLEQIIAQMVYEEFLPEMTYLNKEDLYPARRPRTKAE